jgi:hypothetical protein
VKNQKTARINTLVAINARVSDVSADFSHRQVALKRKLRSVIKAAPAKTEPLIEEAEPTFGSAWLPGPLSYPWLLMFASVPKVIDNLLRQV